MSVAMRNNWRIGAVAVGAIVALSGCGMMQRDGMRSHTQQVTLSGANEVPPFATSASGTGWVRVNPADHSVSAKITVTGMNATAAHIHEGAAGTNGPVIVPFTKAGDNTFVAPPGAKLTPSQHESMKAGKLYVNVHSAKSPDGEVRAQLRGM